MRCSSCCSSFQEHAGTPKKWALYASFSQSLVAGPNFQVNRVFWYLDIEVHFYVLLPLLAFLLARASAGSRGRAALLLGMLGFASFVFFLYAWHLDPTPNPYWQFSLLSTFFFLVAGMLLALIGELGEPDRSGCMARGCADLWRADSAAVCVLTSAAVLLPPWRDVPPLVSVPWSRMFPARARSACPGAGVEPPRRAGRSGLQPLTLARPDPEGPGEKRLVAVGISSSSGGRPAAVLPDSVRELRPHRSAVLAAAAPMGALDAAPVESPIREPVLVARTGCRVRPL